MTDDTEKAFDSSSHSYSLAGLSKIGFGHDFITWIKILLESQESCIINARITTSSFLKKVHCLFILCLEVSFLHVKVNHKTRDVNIFQYNYLYTAHADDTTFLKNKTSIRRLMETFSTFSQYCCLKPSYGKCEVAEIRVLISVKVAVCGMKCIYLCKDTVIITGVRFSYNKHKQDGENLWETKTKI